MDTKEKNYMQLTPVDRKILESYAKMLDGLGVYLGDCYEIVLHSLEDLDCSIIKIINGHYTGRKEGYPITDLALEMLNELKQDPSHAVRPYFTKNKAGAHLRSCTIPIHGEKNRIIGLLCMNFHMESPLSMVLHNFIASPEAVNGILSNMDKTENFSDNVDDLISSALAEVQGNVYANSAITASNKNKEIINQLYHKGIFNLKDAVIKVAEQLNISKNTVYMHIRNIKSKS